LFGIVVLGVRLAMNLYSIERQVLGVLNRLVSCYVGFCLIMLKRRLMQENQAVSSKFFVDGLKKQPEPSVSAVRTKSEGFEDDC
jgi:hypothetical protein